MCPQCGSSAEVRTARELFDMMNGAREQAFQRVNQFRRPGSGPAPGQWQGQGSADDDDYDHYNVEGSDPKLRTNRGRNQGQRGGDFDFVAATTSSRTSAARCSGRRSASPGAPSGGG